jgi:hypothetical protein
MAINKRNRNATPAAGGKSKLGRAWRDVVHQFLAFGWRVP